MSFLRTIQEIGKALETSPEEMRYMSSMIISKDRRDRWKRHRRLEKMLGGVAVVGAGLLAWFCTFDTPYVEAWFIGIPGVILVVPYFVVRNERIK